MDGILWLYQSQINSRSNLRVVRRHCTLVQFKLEINKSSLKNIYSICIFISLIWIHCWQVKFMSTIISLVNFYIQYIKKNVTKYFKVFYRGDSLHARASNLISTYWSTKWCIVPYLYFLLIWNPFFSRYTNEDVEFFKSMPVFVETDE